MFHFIASHIGERTPVSPARPAGQAPVRHGALRSADRRGDRVGRRCRLRDGIRQTCGSPAPGNCPVAAPKSRQVQLLAGWPVGPSWLQLPVVVSALPWA
jgi:hypothetical protein